MTSAGYLNGRKEREASGVRGAGMLVVVTDIGVMEPDENGELMLTALHPNRTAQEARENTGWDLKVAESSTNHRVCHRKGIEYSSE